jgi:hypothetical protein
MITSHLASIEHDTINARTLGRKPPLSRSAPSAAPECQYTRFAVSCMDVGVIVYTAELEAPGPRETAQRILLADAGKLGVLLGRSEAPRGPA